MKRAMTWIVAAALVSVLGFLTAGCNTVRGVGRDIEKGGEKIQEVTSK